MWKVLVAVVAFVTIAIWQVVGVMNQRSHGRVDASSGAHLPAPDPMAFCYADGKPYSEGFTLGEQICSRRGLVRNQKGEPEDRLQWVASTTSAPPPLPLPPMAGQRKCSLDGVKVTGDAKITCVD